MNQTPEAERALPCPWCGNTPDTTNDAAFRLTDGVKYGALQCCVIGPEVRTDYKDVEHWKAKAIAAWNERAIPQAAAEPTDEAIDNALEMARECIVEGFGYKYDEKALAAVIRTFAAPDRAPSIDSATERDAARYEFVRKLNPNTFADLYARNLTGQGAFDDLVDQAIAALKGEGQ